MAVCVTNTGHVVCEKPATAIKFVRLKCVKVENHQNRVLFDDFIRLIIGRRSFAFFTIF